MGSPQEDCTRFCDIWLHYIQTKRLHWLGRLWNGTAMVNEYVNFCPISWFWDRPSYSTSNNTTGFIHQIPWHWWQIYLQRECRQKYMKKRDTLRKILDFLDLSALTANKSAISYRLNSLLTCLQALSYDWKPKINIYSVKMWCGVVISFTGNQ